MKYQICYYSPPRITTSVGLCLMRKSFSFMYTKRWNKVITNSLFHLQYSCFHSLYHSASDDIHDFCINRGVPKLLHRGKCRCLQKSPVADGWCHLLSAEAKYYSYLLLFALILIASIKPPMTIAIPITILKITPTS